MALPGTPGCEYTADGLEHDARGIPSSSAADHAAQLAKRRRKLEAHDYGDLWGETAGSGEVVVVTFGSTWGAVVEAVARRAAGGAPIAAVGLRLLAPLPAAELRRALAGAARVVVVEQNHGGQLFRHLHGARLLPADAESFARPGPLPIRPSDVLAALEAGA
jgi:2-oxoglutarate ferredoxin oxidoreductase subunit alpha